MSSSSSSLQLKQFTKLMNEIAPLSLAGSWDNVGLLVEPSTPVNVRSIFLCIDLTEEVLEEAISKNANVILAYHPPIFSAFKRLTQSDAKQRIIIKAIENKIAIFSPHTSFDAVKGGINDWLASAFKENVQSVDILQPQKQPSPSTHKVVVFCPASDVEKVRDALSEIGCGWIGSYSKCSFMLPGRGTFLGQADQTNPTIGEAGKFETVDEIRLEMVCSPQHLAKLEQTIRKAHSYEEPAFEVIPLEQLPSSKDGQGRIVTLKNPIPLAESIQMIKTFLNLPFVRVAAPASMCDEKKDEGSKKIKTIAICAGSGSSVLNPVRADLYFTGEMSHHDVLAAKAKGTAVVLTEHTNCERGYLQQFQSMLSRSLEAQGLAKQVQIEISKVDEDPLKVM